MHPANILRMFAFSLVLVYSNCNNTGTVIYGHPVYNFVELNVLTIGQSKRVY
jgi:hypothetical protein